ncbi:MAG: BspA family leucine-rich repeat surface protein [Clostridium sp.]|nr:BspA family leucine-rich repeat surface protein [Clostridium sp.]
MPKKTKERERINRKLKNKKGITLIALVVTIVVLLILAGVSVSVVADKNGIIQNSQETKEQTRAAMVEKERDLWKLEEQIYQSDSEKETLEKVLERLEKENTITKEEKQAILETGEVTIAGKTIIFIDGTIVACGNEENSADGSFLGNTSIKRGDIEQINIITALNGHDANDEKTWDISERKNGRYLAWYEDKDNNNFWEVTIAGNGRVKLNKSAKLLFKALGTYAGKIEMNGIENLDTSEVTDMSYMFTDGSQYTDLDLSSFDTSNVTTMSGMFLNCSKLTNLNLANFDTKNVVKLTNLFNGCSAIENINLSSFDTSNVTKMYAMFGNCENLKNVNLKNFDTSKVTDMEAMFFNCKSLSKIDLSNFNTSSVERLKRMFVNCELLTELDLSNFKTENLLNVETMFSGCKLLKKIDMRNATFDKVQNYNYMLDTLPSDVTIIVKDDTQKEWLSSKFPERANSIKVQGQT